MLRLDNVVFGRLGSDIYFQLLGSEMCKSEAILAPALG